MKTHHTRCSSCKRIALGILIAHSDYVHQLRYLHAACDNWRTLALSVTSPSHKQIWLLQQQLRPVRR
jgi:hypothetical protein